MLGVTSQPPGLFGRFFAAWQTSASAWCVLVLLMGLACAYLAGTRRLARFERSWSPWRTASFVGGLAVVEIAVASPLAEVSRSLFRMHVLDLMLLLDVAPSLLALGAPVGLVLEAPPRRVRTIARRLVASRPVHVLTHPALAFAIVLGSTYGYFLTPLYRASMRHDWLLALVDAEFLAAGCLFWWVAIASDQVPHRLSDPGRLVYLGVTIPPAAFLGIDLLNSVRPITVAGSLSDTHIGGAELWGFADLYTLAALALVFLRWMREVDRAEHLGELTIDAVDAAERIVAAAARTLVDPGGSVEGPHGPR